MNFSAAKKCYGQTDGRTDRRTDRPKPICPLNFFEVGGIKSKIFIKYKKKENHIRYKKPYKIKKKKAKAVYDTKMQKLFSRNINKNSTN